MAASVHIHLYYTHIEIAGLWLWGYLPELVFPEVHVALLCTALQSPSTHALLSLPCPPLPSPPLSSPPPPPALPLPPAQRW